MYKLDDIIVFVREQTATQKPIHADTRLVEDIGCVGDDFFALIRKYSEKFKVDITSFIWYFHTPDEASFSNIGALIISPPYHRVDRISITVAMLHDFAKRGLWDVKYPAHQIPLRRYDIYIGWLIIFIVVMSALLLFHLS